MKALRVLNGQLWFGWMGRTCERRVFGIVAGNEIPLLYLVRRPRRVVVRGPDGCFAPRLEGVREQVVREAWSRAGSVSELARRLGVTRQRVTRQTATRWAERYGLR